MVNLVFETTGKAYNSTQIKDFSQSTWRYEGEFVEPFDILHPVVKLWLGANEAGVSYIPRNINYAFIPETSRYYWVRQWEYDSGMWICHLDVDVLATYRSTILTFNAYVNRSSMSTTTSIPDYITPVQAVGDQTTTTLLPTLAGNMAYNLKDGYYVVGILNSDANSVGCVSYYAFDNTNFRAFCKKLMESPNWAFSGITDISESLFKALFNPLQYITSCMWFPTFPQGFVNSTFSMPFGWWNFTVTGFRIGTTTRTFEFKCTMPLHPQFTDRGLFVETAPFTLRDIYWAPIGTVPLDMSCNHNTDLRLQVLIDFCTGASPYKIYTASTNGATTDLSAGSVQIGVPLQIGQIVNDYIGAAKNVLSAVGSGFSLDVSGAVNGVLNAAESLIPAPSTSGTNGSVAGFAENPVLHSRFYTSQAPVKDVVGLPFGGFAQLRTHAGGYVQCGTVLAVDTGVGMFPEEKQAIVTQLQSGVYLD